MGDCSFRKSGYGIELYEDDIQKIKSYVEKDEHWRGDQWWYYFENTLFSKVPIIVQSDEIYRGNEDQVDGRSCFIGIELWKSPERLLKMALKEKLTIPDKVNEEWKQIAKYLRKCGIGRRRPRFFIITYIS